MLTELSTLCFVFARFVRGKFLRMDIPMSVRGCLDTLAWVGVFDANFVGFPCPGWIFRDLLVLPGCREENLLFDRGRCMFVMQESARRLIHDIKYHGARMILRDMPSWMERSEGFREYLEGAVLVPVPLHRRRLGKRGLIKVSGLLTLFVRRWVPVLK